MTSPGARYSAGTAFLDVVPSFRGVQEAIRKKAKEMEKALGKEAGDQFGKSFGDSAERAIDKTLGTKSTEKQGAEAGKKYGGAFAAEVQKAVASSQKEVRAALRITTDDDAAQRSLREIEARLKTLGKAKIGVDMDSAAALTQIRLVALQLDKLAGTRDIGIRTNFGAVSAAVAKARKEIEKLSGIVIEPEIKFDEKRLGLFERKIRERLKAAMESIPDVEFNVDTTRAMSQLQRLRAEMQTLMNKRIGVDIDGSDALAEMARINSQLAAMQGDKEVDVRVRTDAAAAAAELTKISALVELVDGKKATVKVELESDTFAAKMRRIRNDLLGADTDGRTAADGFRAFNAVVLAGAALLPAAAPAIVGIAGALALVGPIALGAAAGLGVLAIGFTGIGDAVGALGKVQENSGKDAEASAKRIRSASRSVEDAERSVDRARSSAAQSARSASRAVEDAVQQQRDAEVDLGRAQKQVQQAQEDLTRARKEATEQLEDLQLAVRGGALSERDAVLDLKDAQEELDAAREAGATGDELDRLILKYDQAVFRLDEVKERNGDLADQQAEWARTGVEGSEQVQQAREGVTRAEEGVQAAMRGVADAARGVQDAIVAQQENATQSAQAIEDAQRNLTQAQEDYTTAVNETSASQQALEVAMGKLGPAGQEFALFWSGLLPQFREMRDLVQAGMFPGLQDAITQILTVNGPQLRDFMGTMGQTLGDMFAQFGDMMASPQWQGIWATFSEYAPTFMQQFGQVGMAMLTFFGELFQALAPYAERFGDKLVEIAWAWADWAARVENSQGFKDVMEWLFKNGGDIFEDIWGIIKGLGALFIAIVPIGMVILNLLGGLGNWLASLDPKVLGAIVMVILGLVVAFQLAVGAVSLVAGAMVIAEVALAAWIFAIVAVIAALVALYIYSEDFRNAIDVIFRAIGDGIRWVVDNMITPAIEWFSSLFDENTGVIKRIWEEQLMPVFRALGDFIVSVYDNVLKPVFDAWMTIWGVLWKYIQEAWDRIGYPVFLMVSDILLAVWGIVKPILELMWMAWLFMFNQFMVAWDVVGAPLFKLLVETIEFLWKYVFDPIIGFLIDRWASLWGAVRLAWDMIGAPVFGFIQAVLETLVAVFKGNFDELSKIWNGFWEKLKDAAAAPVNFVIKFVLNDGLFKAFNWVIDTLHLPAEWKIGNMDQVGDPSTHYAAGGRVAGWSPNDKADNIPAMLTAGEYVHPVDSVKYYGADVMEMIRKRRIPREALEDVVHDPRQRYATGGFVTSRRRPDEAVYMQPQNIYGAGDRVILPAHAATGAQLFAIVKAAFPRARMNDGYRPGANDMHGRNMAVDLGEEGFSGGIGRPYLAAMNRWIYDTFGSKTSELIYTGLGDDRPDLKNGAPLNYGLATSLAHKNHVHWAMSGDPGGPPAFFAGMSANGSVDGGGGFWGALGGAGAWIGDQFGKVWGAATDVLGSLKDSIVGPIKDLKDKFGDGVLGKVFSAIPENLVGKLWDKAKDAVADFFTFGGTDSPDASGIIPTQQKSGEVQNIVRAIAARYGWNQGGEWTALYNLIQKESGWNPNAQNPSSTAYGLFQFLNGTWAGTSVKKTSDPELQAIAGLEYISGKYGTPSSAWAYHQKHNSYSDGGEVTADGHGATSAPAAPTLYDSGGWLPPGITTVLNATNKPEPILTAAQWSELTAERDGGEDWRGIRDLHLHEQAYDVSEAIDTVNHEVRKMQRTGGRYAGAGTGGN